MRVTRAFIHMAENEYGNNLMEQAAREFALANRRSENLFVTVYEHGGWYLTYYWEDGRLICVGSANGSAIYSGRAREIREEFFNADLPTTYHSEVWRENSTLTYDYGLEARRRVVLV